MKKLVAGLLFCSAICAAPAGAQQVIDFEANCDQTLGLYQGVNFNNLFTCYTSPQYPYTPSSGNGRVYTSNSGAGGNTFNLAGPSVFSGAWFAGNGATVNFNLFLNNVLVGTSGSLTVDGTPTFLGSGYAGAVDAVEVFSDANDYFVMDDVSIGAAVLATPEPASVALLGTGLIGLFGVARRRRKV